MELPTTKTRDELQKEALNLAKENKNIALEWATGLGKSKTAIDIINYTASLKPNGGLLRCLLVVAETAHKENWNKEFKKWGLQSTVIVECYASLKNYFNTSWDLLILDEAHHTSSELRQDILSTIKSERVLLLSATLGEDNLLNMGLIFGEFKVHRVTLRQAIKYNIIPQPKVYLIPMELNNTAYNQEVIEEWGRKEKRVEISCNYEERWGYIRNKYKFPNVTLKMKCTEAQAYDYVDSKVTYWKNRYFISRLPFMKVKWTQAGSVRKRLLGELKTECAKVLLDKIKMYRYICFCASINQAKELGESHAIYSGKSDSQELIDKFNSGKINNLLAVGMLQEGENLKDIQMGVIIQLDGKERLYIQKSGRTLRAKEPIQYIFYFKNTRDEEFLNKILLTIDKKYVTSIIDLQHYEVEDNEQ